MNDFQITECMIEKGGKFVSGLAKLWRIADPSNRDKLKTAFAEYFAKYAELAEIDEFSQDPLSLAELDRWGSLKGQGIGVRP